MKNLIGFWNQIFQLSFIKYFYFFIFIFLTILLIYNSNSVFAQSTSQSLKSEAKILYQLKNNSLESELKFTIKSSSDYPTVVNYYKVPISLTGIDKVEANDRNQSYYVRATELEDWSELTIDLKEKVITKGNPYTFSVKFRIDDYIKSAPGLEEVDFNSVQLEEITKKLIFPAQLSKDTKIESIQVVYPLSWGIPKYSTYRYSKYERIGNYINILFRDLDDIDSSLSLIVGQDVSYDFHFNKTIANNDEHNRIYELNIPKTHYNQELTFSEITPLPSSSKIDDEGNLFFMYEIPPNKSLSFKVRGNIVFDNSTSVDDLNLNERKILTSEKKYWIIEDENELDRLDFYLENQNSETNTEITKSIYKYVLDRLDLSTNSLSSDEVDLKNTKIRAGAKGALERKGDNIPEDYSDLYIAFLRHYNIPSKLSIGYVLPAGHKQEGFFHYWVEVWDESEGWVIYDPALDDFFKDRNLLEIEKVDHITLVSRGHDSVSPKLSFYQPDEYEFSLAPIRSDPSSDFRSTLTINPTTLFESNVEVNLTFFNTGNTVLKNFEFTSDAINTGNQDLIEKVLLPNESYSKKVYWDSTQLFNTDSANKNSLSGVVIAKTLKNQKVFYPINFKGDLTTFWWWDWFLRSVSIFLFLGISLLTTKVIRLYNKMS